MGVNHSRRQFRMPQQFADSFNGNAIQKCYGGRESAVPNEKLAAF
jgi:hypothetical protein